LFDKFHVIRHLGEALDQVRRRAFHTAPHSVYRAAMLASRAGRAPRPPHPLMTDASIHRSPARTSIFAIVEEVGAITFFLASDAAAAIAGVVGRVDGGWTAR
jgi:NAD(P)-dependent dehydrogenase (short-subunit alcohol dehydrogenase family)